MSIGKIHKAGRRGGTRPLGFPPCRGKTGPERTEIPENRGIFLLFSYNKARMTGKNINFDTIKRGNPGKIRKREESCAV